MKKASSAAAALGIVLVMLVLAAGRPGRDQVVDPGLVTGAAIDASTGAAASKDHQGFLYGRVTTDDGSTYERRLRWGGDEKAFWGDDFNGFKNENSWAAHVPPERLKEYRPVEVFGNKTAPWGRRSDLGRPFMGRFGDIARIEARGRDFRE